MPQPSGYHVKILWILCLIFLFMDSLDIMAKEDIKDSTCLTQTQRDQIAKAIPSLTPTQSSDNSKPLNGVRIGIPQEFNIAELSPSSLARWRVGIQALKDSGATVLPVSLPNTKLAVGAYVTLGTAEASSNLQRYDGIRYGKDYGFHFHNMWLKTLHFIFD